MGRKMRTLVSIVIQLLCVTGFLVQVSQVSNTFFQYKTRSKVLLENRDVIVVNGVPNLLLCMTYTDIMDLGKLNAKYGTNFNRTKSFSGLTDMQANLTLKQIFDFTPSTEDVIESCIHRTSDGLVMHSEQRDRCRSKFTVYRFYVQSFMCYGFKYLFPVNFTSKQVSNSLNDANILYGVQLGPGFVGADMIMVCVFYGTYPTTSRLYSVLVNRLADFQSMRVRNHVYSFGYSSNQVELMRPPYETNCEDGIRDQTGNNCRKRCFQPLEDQIQRQMFTTFAHTGIDRKHVSYHDLEDEPKRRLIQHQLDLCSQRCAFRPCTYNYSITFFDMAMKVESAGQKVTLMTRTAKAPGLNVQFEAKLPLMEFMIYVCSCIGIWFGLSFQDLNPFDPNVRRVMVRPMTYVHDLYSNCSCSRKRTMA